MSLTKHCGVGVILTGIAVAGCNSNPSSSTQPSSASSKNVAVTATNPAPSILAEKEKGILSEVVQLSHGFSRAGEAYFSPDMKWIIFQATARGEQHYSMYVAPLIYKDDRIVGADTPTRISLPGSQNTCGYFSPDGNSVIFASTGDTRQPDEPPAGYQRQGGNYRWAFPAGMEIYRLDGWPRIQSTLRVETYAPRDASLLSEPTSAPATQGKTVKLTSNDAYDAEGAYSPDGKWIVFGSRRDGDSEIYAMKANGSAPVRLTENKGYDGGPFFSPDGKRIVYRSDRKGNDLLQIFTADLKFDKKGDIIGAANERQLTDDENVNWGPYWHPDGRHVIYATSIQGHQNYELYLMRDDGSHPTRITYTEGFDGLPVFSPDGTYLMWSSKRSSDGTTQIFLARFKLPKGS